MRGRHESVNARPRGIRWCGFDYGETLMDPSGLRNSLLWGDVYKSVGRPELAADKVHAYRVLREAYGEYYTVKEAHRHEVFTFVMGGDDQAQQAFMEAEPRLLGHGDHVHEALQALSDAGIVLDVVSELIRTVGPIDQNVILRFLTAHDLRRFFRFLVTPLGKIDVATGTLVDERYRGHTKGDGTIYDVLVQDLAEQGISTREAVMVGDRPSTDIVPAHARGLRTVQYAGYSHRAQSPAADALIDDFRDLPPLMASWTAPAEPVCSQSPATHREPTS